MSKCDPMAVDFQTPSRGTLTPLSAEGAATARMLKRSLSDVYGSWLKRDSVAASASEKNTSASEAV